MKAEGFLAIWSDVAPVDETDYLHWLTREHIAERLGTPGFLSAQVYRALLDEPRYLILYWLQDAGVLSSPAYVARLNGPTPWSQRIMPKLSGFRRGGGAVRIRSRRGAGGVIAPVIDPSHLAIQSLAPLAAADGIVSVSLLETDRGGTDIPTAEKGLRGRDGSFDALLLIEALSEDLLAAALRSHGALQEQNQAYRLVFSQAATPL